MAQYFMQINGQQVGPMDESVLLLNGLTPTTPVWTDGMANWLPANQVPGLAHLFAGNVNGSSVPPAFGAPYQQPAYDNTPQHRVPMPDNNLVWGILVTLFCCMPLGIVSIVKASQVSTLYSQGRYAEAEAAGKSAGKWAMWGAISSLVGVVLYIVFVLIMVGLAGGIAALEY